MSDLNFFNLIKNLDDDHRKNLLWFWENKSKIMKWSDIRDSSETNKNFAKVLKGIYRPAQKNDI